MGYGYKLFGVTGVISRQKIWKSLLQEETTMKRVLEVNIGLVYLFLYVPILAVVAVLVQQR